MMKKAIPRRGPRGRSLAATLALALVSSAALSVQEKPGIDDARGALSEWVDTQRLISKERNDWALGKEMLEDRIGLMEREIESFRTRLADTESSIAKADETRTELGADKERLEQAASSLRAIVGGLEARTADLLRRLPDPVRERVKPLSQRFPEDPEDTKLSLSDRFMNVVGILNAVDKFHREITVTSEVRTLPSGDKAEVAAMYVGIGYGYYATQDGTAAGAGSSSEAGWEWRPADGSAEDVLRAIAILQNEAAAGFVRLPVRIDRGAPR